MALVWIWMATGAPAAAELAHVRGAEIARNPYGLWSGVVLIEHEDEGWSHFCDRWEVLDQDGLRILFRDLSEPKIKDVEEGGPVRRRHREFPIPPGTTRLTYRAHCKRSGWGGESFDLDLSRIEGPGFRVRRGPDRPLADFENVIEHMRTELRQELRRKVKWPYPPRGPVSARPPVPHDSRPRVKRHPR